MNSRLAALLMMVVLALAPAAFAGGKKNNKASITFHMETEGTDNPKMIFPQLANGEQRFFRRMPEITTKDIESFSPFPSELGEYGLVLKLKRAAANRLTAITSANQSRWMITQVNGRVVDGILIDKQIDDGVLVVWKGVTLADIDVLDDVLPRSDEVAKKKKK